MLDRHPKKPCKYCMKTGHFPFQCPVNRKQSFKRSPVSLQHSTKPMKRSRMKQQGKQAELWKITRAKWIETNPPPIAGKYWICYLQIHEWCPKLLTVDKSLITYDVGLLTVDHIVARTRDPSLRLSMENLAPACEYCNEKKGSRSLDEVQGSL